MQVQDIEATARIKLLLVDDSDVFRQLVMAYLKKLPFEFTEASDGRLALNLMKSQVFDLVLMDLKMPDMDGATATKLYREWEKQTATKPLVIIALSAFNVKHDRDDFYQAGCDEYLTKPIRKHDLIESIMAILDRHDLME